MKCHSKKEIKCLNFDLDLFLAYTETKCFVVQILWLLNTFIVDFNVVNLTMLYCMYLSVAVCGNLTSKVLLCGDVYSCSLFSCSQISKKQKQTKKLSIWSIVVNSVVMYEEQLTQKYFKTKQFFFCWSMWRMHVTKLNPLWNLCRVNFCPYTKLDGVDFYWNEWILSANIQ